MRLVKVILAVCLLVIPVLQPTISSGQQQITLPAESVTLAWSPSPDTSVTGYKLYYGDVSSNQTNRLDMGLALTATVSNLQTGVTYFFFATAYNASLNESEPSNVITYTPTATNYPDLIISSVCFTPLAPMAGNLVQFRAVILNQGVTATPPGVNFRVCFSVDGQPPTAWCNISNSLPVGASITVFGEQGVAGTFPWNPVAGLHSVTATVDDLQMLNESDEANNQLQTVLPVSPALPLVSISLDKTNVAESDGAGVMVTIFHSGNSATALNIALAFGGSASNGVDYAALPDAIAIPAGSNCVCFRLIPIPDGVVDEDKFVELSLSPSPDYQIALPGGGSILIANVDMDAVPTSTESVTLAWSPSPDDSVVGYKLYYGRVSATETNSLDVGSALSATVSNLQMGVTYFFFATAYNASGVESEPSNFLTYTPAIPTVYPDLVIGAVTCSPSSPLEGNLVRFGAVITNQGSQTVPAGAAVRVGFSVDGAQPVVWCRFTNSILPGGSATILSDAGLVGSGNWTAVAGQHMITATVDDLSLVSESNETNNQAQSITFVVALPTASVPSVWVALEKPTVTEGDSTGVKVTLSRSGNTTSALSVALYLWGTARNGVDYASLPATVTVPAGTNCACFRLIPIPNGIADGTKSVHMNLLPDASYQLKSPTSATLMITDQDVDSDGDGMTDSIEALAGTDPYDANSNLKILSLDAGQFGQITLNWSSVPGIIYRVMSRDSLSVASWQPASPPITAVSQITSWTLPTVKVSGFFGLSLVSSSGN